MKTLEVELVLPSASVALAVMSVVVFSAKVTFLLKFPLSSAVVVPNELPATPDNIVITATDIAGNTETHNVVITMVIKLAVTILPLLYQ
jgi:hypothetical protein